MSLVNCIKRLLPIVKCKNILPMNISRINFFYKVEQKKLTFSRFILFSNNKTLTKSVIFGFSLLGLFGLDEEIDSELKLINTIKKGLLYLQVKLESIIFY